MALRLMCAKVESRCRIQTTVELNQFALLNMPRGESGGFFFEVNVCKETYFDVTGWLAMLHGGYAAPDWLSGKCRSLHMHALLLFG